MASNTPFLYCYCCVESLLCVTSYAEHAFYIEETVRLTPAMKIFSLMLFWFPIQCSDFGQQIRWLCRRCVASIFAGMDITWSAQEAKQTMYWVRSGACYSHFAEMQANILSCEMSSSQTYAVIMGMCVSVNYSLNILLMFVGNKQWLYTTLCQPIVDALLVKYIHL